MAEHIVLATSLNLRVAPERDAGSLGTMPRFTRVEEVDANPDRSWLKVRVNQRVGWASNDYLLPAALRELPWMARAIGEFGVGEYEDSSDPPENPRIRDYHDLLGGGPAMRRETVAWCSAFANWCLHGLFGTAGIDRSARSWGNWGVEVEPEPGAIVVFWRRPGAAEDAGEHAASKEALIQNGSYGHVGFLVELLGGRAIVLGGNQSSRANALGEVNKRAYPLDSDDYGLLVARRPH